MTFPMRNGEPAEDELEKILAAYALGGSSLVAFDNITGNLAGAALDKVLTAVRSIDLRPENFEAKIETELARLLQRPGEAEPAKAGTPNVA